MDTSRLRRPGRRVLRALRAAATPSPITRERAVSRIERLNAMTMLVSSTEHLARPGDRVRGGYNDWDVERRKLHSRAPRFGALIDVAARPAATQSLHAARIGASLALLAPSGRRIRTAAGVVAVASSFLLHPRAFYGTDGTDQVGFLSATGSALARILHRRPALVDSVLWGVALQATLSYGASGWVKMTSHTWRSGAALAAVARTKTYGDLGMWRLLVRFPRAARAIGASVLAMECLFPTVYVWGGRVAPAWLHGTTFFHLVNARVMGLGRFVWAFGSMHPAVLYTTDRRNRGSRDDTMPRVTAALGATALLAGTAAQARRRRRVLSTGRGLERLRTPLGNELAFERSGPAEDDGPVIVLEHGLLSTPLLWQWTVDALAGRHQVVTYARAGYGASTYAGNGDYTLDDSVDDLVELAWHVSRDGRPVVLAGHSLGGWLAVRAAERAADRVCAVALVDCSHPGELQRSSRQAQGQEAVTRNLMLVLPSLSLGLGNLVPPPEFKLPERVQRRFLDEYRDARMWKAGLREWRAVESEFGAFSGALPQLACPVLSLTAEFTARLDPIQADLHEELSTISRVDGHHAEVPGVDHEGIVVDPAAAAAVADHLAHLAARAAARTTRREVDHVATR
jgi:pimeloyl-ACP methyl ester carboxylesterase